MAALVAGYLRESNLRDVTIVAHSKGGLVGKRAMLHSASAGRIRHMVAVNSPFSGSIYARLFWAPSIRAFSPRNRGLRALAADLSVNHRITSVYSAFDPHIPGGSHLPGATNIELDSAGTSSPWTIRSCRESCWRPWPDRTPQASKLPGVPGREALGGGSLRRICSCPNCSPTSRR